MIWVSLILNIIFSQHLILLYYLYFEKICYLLLPTMTIRYNDFFTANYDVNRKGQSIIFIDLSHNRVIRKRTNNNLRR